MASPLQGLKDVYRLCNRVTMCCRHTTLSASAICLTPKSRCTGNSEGAATLTADLVDLGYVRAVTWIVLNLVDRDRSDIIVEVRILKHTPHCAHATTCTAANQLSWIASVS